MSIADGRRIAIRFTQSLIGNVLGLDPPLGYKKSKISMNGASVSALNVYSTSYPASNAVDGSTSTYWRGTTAINWLRIKLREPKVVTRLRLYLGSYYVKTFTLSGSNDGNTWTQIGGTYTAASTTTSQWYSFDIENPDAYLYYRIDTLTTYSSTVYIYEVELYETVPTGNETKFTVSFDQYNYVPEGSLSRVTRPVVGLENFCTLDSELDLSEGLHENTEYSGGRICLTMKEAE